MSAFLGDLVVKLVKDDKQGGWELQQPFGYQSDVAKQTFMAPKGFRTDFCSVPRVPFGFEVFGNTARRAGTIHDWLYTSHVVPREMADKVLREMVQVDGVTRDQSEIFYLGVRAGGASHWGPDPKE